MELYDLKEKLPDPYQIVGLYFLVKAPSGKYCFTLGLGYFTDLSKKTFTVVNFARYKRDNTIIVDQNTIPFDDVLRWTNMVIPEDIINEANKELEKRNEEKSDAV